MINIFGWSHIKLSKKQVRSQSRFHPSGYPDQPDDRCGLEHCWVQEEADSGNSERIAKMILKDGFCDDDVTKVMMEAVRLICDNDTMPKVTIQQYYDKGDDTMIL